MLSKTLFTFKVMNHLFATQMDYPTCKYEVRPLEVVSKGVSVALIQGLLSKASRPTFFTE